MAIPVPADRQRRGRGHAPAPWRGSLRQAAHRREARRARQGRSTCRRRSSRSTTAARLAYDRLLIATGSTPAQPADPRHRQRRRAALLDAEGRARDRAACRQGRARAADGRGLHRLHHHGVAGRARRAAHRGRDGRPHGAAHDGADGRRHDQGLVREQGRARVHRHARRGDRKRRPAPAAAPAQSSGGLLSRMAAAVGLGHHDAPKTAPSSSASSSTRL